NEVTETQVAANGSSSPSGDFVIASSYLKRTNSLASLANGMDNLEFNELGENVDKSPQATNKSSRDALVELEQNVLQESGQKSQKKQNKEFAEKFLTGNTFNNCTFHF
ncbi:20086_t:CDS:1, partial [Racocetra fulgida]